MKKEVKQSIRKKEIKIMKYKLSLILKDMFLIIFGTYLISLGTNMFLLPYKMSTGGASGIATIFYYLFDVPLGITIMIINAPLFVISMRKFGIKTSFKTIISTVLLSVFLELFTYSEFVASTPLDLITASIFGGIVVGIGLSLVLKTGASTGGSDLLAQIIYKCTSVQSLSQVLLTIEIVIISAIMLVFKDINLGLYSIISMFLSSKVIDIFIEGINYIKVVTIITQKPDDIVDKVIHELQRSATITNTIGAHSKENNTTLTCIITRPQIAKLKNIVLECDERAIMYIVNVNEAIGKGFKQIS